MSGESAGHEEARKLRKQADREAMISHSLKDSGRKKTRRKPDAPAYASLKRPPAKRLCPDCRKTIVEPFKREARICPHCGSMTPF